MVKMVDSQKNELSVEDIVGIAGMNTDAGVQVGQLIQMINAELNMPDTLFLRQGNTLFIIHKAEPRVGFFRALNADTANNFLQNSMEFIKACYKMGFDTMATEFDDPTLLSIFRYISNNPPNPNMGYQVDQTDDGGYFVTVQCGPRREA
jgi:hypothetical protein